MSDSVPEPGEGERVYYHGGVRGLKPGDKILPPSVLGIKAAADFCEGSGLDVGHVRTDRVFVTTEFAAAVMFGAMFPHKKGGWAYVVEPTELENDPDFLVEPVTSVQCEYATVIIGKPVPLNDVRKIRWAFGV